MSFIAPCKYFQGAILVYKKYKVELMVQSTILAYYPNRIILYIMLY